MNHGVGDRVEKILRGDERSASRLIRDIEDDISGTRELIRALWYHAGQARIIGVTGSPGAGKSTAVGGLIGAYIKTGQSIGVLCVDPSSPFSGGALLGDRLRLQQHAGTPGVFIRSFATRGVTGGLSRAVGDAITILDAMGKDIILLESAGAGQQDVNIAHHVHTVLLILVPGMGDAIQVIKAGIMEIADIFIVNKAHRQGASDVIRDLTELPFVSRANDIPWTPLVLSLPDCADRDAFAVAIDGVAAAVDDHYRDMVENGRFGARLRRRAYYELSDAINWLVYGSLMEKLSRTGEIDAMVSRIVERDDDPYSMADTIIREQGRSVSFNVSAGRSAGGCNQNNDDGHQKNNGQRDEEIDGAQ